MGGLPLSILASESGAPDGHPVVAIRRRQRVLRMTQQVMDEIGEEVYYDGCERAGMLVGPKGVDLATVFVPDRGGKGSVGSFEVDADGLNNALRNYLAVRHDMKGIVHSHPKGVIRPSDDDVAYAMGTLRLDKNCGAYDFWMAIVEGGLMHAYRIDRNQRVLKANIVVV